MVEGSSTGAIGTVGHLDTARSALLQSGNRYIVTEKCTHLGMFFLGTETVSHHPAPASNDTFSSTVNCLTSWLTSASKKDRSNWSFVFGIMNEHATKSQEDREDEEGGGGSSVGDEEEALGYIGDFGRQGVAASRSLGET